MTTVQVEERVRRLEGAYPALAMRVYVAEPENRAARRFADLRAEIAESKSATIRWTLAIGGLVIAAITVIGRVFG